LCQAKPLDGMGRAKFGYPLAREPSRFVAVNVSIVSCKGVAMSKESEPIELRPRATADGRVDVASVRWTIEHMHSELAGNTDLSRVRNALAIAMLELDKVQRQDAVLSAPGLGWSHYLPWPNRG
jgi:hypothetical protein